MKLYGMTPPLTWSTNSKPAPRGQRLDAQVDLAELAGAARLLLVARMAFGVGPDRLAVGDARRPRVHLDLVLLRHALERRAQVQLAQPAQDGLVQHRVVLDDKRWVFGRHPVQHFGDALLVATALGRDRHPAHRGRELERTHVDLVLVVRVVQHAVEIDLVDLGDGGDVARNSSGNLDGLATLQHEQVPDLEGLAAVADEKLRVLGDRALVHAEDSELADVRIDDDLEHVREHVLFRDRARSGIPRPTDRR